MKLTKQIKQEFEAAGIKLVKVKSRRQAASKVGIHLLRPSRHELYNALESAVKDNFPAVYVHDFYTWGSQNSKPEKEHRLEIARSWLRHYNETGMGQSALEKLGFDPEEVIKTMTVKQLRLLASLACVSYGAGCSMTREHLKSLRQSA